MVLEKRELKDGVLLVGGRAVAGTDEDGFQSRVSGVLGSFLQLKNLSVLVGAGASYDLGSPRIRAMTADDIGAMLKRTDTKASSGAQELIKQLVERSGGKADLEKLLATLGAALSFGPSSSEVEFAGVSASPEVLAETRMDLNHALALDCDLPKTPDVDVDGGFDPLMAHRAFFRRLLRSRRLDLPRIRVFTTNYDLVIEKALDQDGITYFDGFSGTVARSFRPESFDRDLYLPPDPDQGRMLRVPDVLYLHKLHGSINWRIARGSGVGRTDEVVQAGSLLDLAEMELALIFPTPLKEGDVLAYPYSVLFRTFMAALAEPDAALLTVGYGFADDHINRQILQALGAPSFQMFSVAPSSVLDECKRDQEGELDISFASTPLAALAQASDARITVLTGEQAGRFENLALQSMPDSSESGDATPTQTQAMLAAAMLGNT